MMPSIRVFLTLCGLAVLPYTPGQTAEPPLEPPPPAVLARALEAVGIDAILDDVAPALDDALPDACGEGDVAFRRTVFQSSRLRSTFERSLSAQLDLSTLAAVGRWYDSAEGRAVARHEAASSTLADDDVAARIPTIAGAADWPQRKALVRATLQGSRTAPFLTRFHSTLDGIVTRAEHCHPDAATLARLDDERSEALDNESFVALFIDIELIVPTAVIYDGLPDATLQAYARFASSPAGARWFNALQHSVGETLQAAGDRYVRSRLSPNAER